MRVRHHHHLTEMNIHKDWSRTVFRKYRKFQKFITSLFFLSDFHNFVPFCRDHFSLFLWNDVHFGPDFLFKIMEARAESERPLRQQPASTAHAFDGRLSLHVDRLFKKLVQRKSGKVRSLY